MQPFGAHCCPQGSFPQPTRTTGWPTGERSGMPCDALYPLVFLCVCSAVSIFGNTLVVDGLFWHYRRKSVVKALCFPEQLSDGYHSSFLLIETILYGFEIALTT